MTLTEIIAVAIKKTRINLEEERKINAATERLKFRYESMVHDRAILLNMHESIKVVILPALQAEFPDVEWLKEKSTGTP